MKLKGKRTLIIGLGRTGMATARFLIRRGASVIVADDKPFAELAEDLKDLGLSSKDLVDTKRGFPVLDEIELIVPSPGVPPFNPLLNEGVQRGIAILSELELAFRYLKTPLISITGTNGKTTTTRLIGEMLKAGGIKAFVGGNIGNPLIAYVDGTQDSDYAVIEVSSFQLQWVYEFHSHTAVLLNVTKDHIDYHGDFEGYRMMKERIFLNQTANDAAIIRADYELSENAVNNMNAEVFSFSSSRPVSVGMYRDGDLLRYRDTSGNEETYAVSRIAIKGDHNLENAMAAIMVSRRCGCTGDSVRSVLETFSGIPHRIEFAGEVGGTAFYNDSKGTNVDAVRRALESFEGPLILLMGGRDKGGDYGILRDEIEKKVRKLILFGEAKDKIGESLDNIVTTEYSENLRDAFLKAVESMKRGDAVLLSPGCSSFDEFKNYEKRGEFFKKEVTRLTHSEV